jgi:hypothetical protein
VKNWKAHTADLYLFKAKFPLGDPTIAPVFFGNQPKAVQDGANYSAPVYTKETGNEQTYRFGISAARFHATAKPADREETLAILTGGLPPKGLTKSEPKTVTWGGQQVTETTWTDPASSTKWIIRPLVTNDAVYIGYIRDLGHLTPSDVASFFDSFELLRQPKPQ